MNAVTGVWTTLVTSLGSLNKCEFTPNGNFAILTSISGAWIWSVDSAATVLVPTLATWPVVSAAMSVVSIACTWSVVSDAMVEVVRLLIW